MRSNSMKMCIADFQMFTSSMINLLNDPLFLHVDKNSQDAILKIKKVIYIRICSEDKRGYIHLYLSSFLFSIENGWDFIAMVFSAYLNA